MAERYYNSRKSNLDKTGEPLSHFIAKCRIKKILEDLGFTVFTFPEEDTPKEAKLTVTFKLLDISYTKSFDIVAIRIFPKTNLNITLIVEVDGEIHQKKNQKWRDHFAEKIVDAVVENLEFERIDKDFVNDMNTTDDMIRKALHLDFYKRYDSVM